MSSQHTLKQNKSKSKLITQVAPSKSYITIDFQYKFQQYCLENGCELLPTVEVEGQPRDNGDVGLPMLLISYKAGDKDCLEKLCYKNFQMPMSVMQAIQTCLEENLSISVLKLEFCNMTSEQIEILSNFLVEHPTITEVSVNGNPNKEQNFHLLLKDTKLLSLSLKCCSIDNVGIEEISKELSKPYESTLLHLNLASNLLFNEGVDYVAKFLRINRTLLSLNLADNKIYNEGCLKLLEPLQKFPLELDEIIIRRQIRFAAFKNNMELASLLSCTSTLDTEDKSEKTTSTRSLNRSSKDKASVGSRNSVGSRKSSSLKQPKLEIEIHPFVQDSCPENQEIYCKGNNTLTSLNLCYNRLRKEGLNAINQMLIYQHTTFANDKGISRIFLIGNEFDSSCAQEIDDFEDLIARRSRRSSSISSKNQSQASFRKRTSRPSRTSRVSLA